MSAPGAHSPCEKCRKRHNSAARAAAPPNMCLLCSALLQSRKAGQSGTNLQKASVFELLTSETALLCAEKSPTFARMIFEHARHAALITPSSVQAQRTNANIWVLRARTRHAGVVAVWSAIGGHCVGRGVQKTCVAGKFGRLSVRTLRDVKVRG